MDSPFRSGREEALMKLSRAAATMSMFAFFVFGAVQQAAADEGGVSFWLPGQFASFAALPGDAGWSLPFVYLHVDGDIGSNRNLVIGGTVAVGVDAKADLLLVFPTYTFQQPMFGAQNAFGLGWGAGWMNVSADATLTGPNGNVLALNQDDDVSGGSDLYALYTMKWSKDQNNYLLYGMGGVPVGSYEKGRLANVGINHWSLDGGGGYTFMNPKKGQELSAVLGFTYNFENEDTQYQNGVDSHLDFAVSQFLSESVHVGLVGYTYYQLSGDSGDGAVLGDFKSRVSGLGPEVGRFFEVGKSKGYAQAKVYWEFDAKNRAEGWNLWLSLVLPLGAEKA
jgi:hypothetical protein